MDLVLREKRVKLGRRSLWLPSFYFPNSRDRLSGRTSQKCLPPISPYHWARFGNSSQNNKSDPMCNPARSCSTSSSWITPITQGRSKDKRSKNNNDGLLSIIILSVYSIDHKSYLAFLNSARNGCCRAYLAVIRFSGLFCSMRPIKLASPSSCNNIC